RFRTAPSAEANQLVHDMFYRNDVKRELKKPPHVRAYRSVDPPPVGARTRITSSDASSCSKVAGDLARSTSISGFGPRARRTSDAARYAQPGSSRCRRSP